jgi:hypothetical protein
MVIQYTLTLWEDTNMFVYVSDISQQVTGEGYRVSHLWEYS